MAAPDDDPNDQLDDFIHSYSYPDYDGLSHPSDDEDISGSDSGSEPPEDLSAEAEDMALYDLYDNSSRPSPQPPSSPMLQDARLELDVVLENMSQDAKSQCADRRNRTYTAFPLSAKKPGETFPVVVEEDLSENGIDSNDDNEKSRGER